MAATGRPRRGDRRPTKAPRLLASITIPLLGVSLLAAGENLLRLKGPDGPLLDPRAIPAVGMLDPEGAILLATDELRRSPHDPAIWAARADLLAATGNWIEAVRDYQTSLELDPHDAMALNNFAWLLLEAAPEGLRNWTEAGNLAARALEAAPEDPYVLGTYGTWLLRVGEPAEAAGFFRRALATQRPAAADATDRYLLAIALTQVGRVDEARVIGYWLQVGV